MIRTSRSLGILSALTIVALSQLGATTRDAASMSEATSMPSNDPADPPSDSLVAYQSLHSFVPGGRTNECTPNRYTQDFSSRWYAIDDQERYTVEESCIKGTSTSKIEPILEGPTGEICGGRWSGSVTRDYKFSFSALGVNLHGSLSNFRHLVLLVRGDGRYYRAQFPRDDQIKKALNGSCDNKDFDFHGQTFRCGDGSKSWVEVVIHLDQLLQEGWGNVWKLDRSKMHKLQIKTTEHDIPKFQCDVQIQGLH